MRIVNILLILLLTGCGKSILGPQTENAEIPTAVNVSNYTQYNVKTLITDYLWWEVSQGGLNHKRISVSVLYQNAGDPLGTAEIGGEKMKIYLDGHLTTVELVATVAHETDHLRGKKHDNMPDNNYYLDRAKMYLNTRPNAHMVRAPRGRQSLGVEPGETASSQAAGEACGPETTLTGFDSQTAEN